MKLAAQLLETSTRKDAVVNNIKDRIQAVLLTHAQRGGQMCVFNFACEDLTVQDRIITWLEEEGFVVARVDEVRITVDWSPPQDINKKAYHRIQEAIDKYRRLGVNMAVFYPTFLDESEEFERYFDSLRNVRYVITRDDSRNRYLIEWKN